MALLARKKNRAGLGRFKASIEAKLDAARFDDNDFFLKVSARFAAGGAGIECRNMAVRLVQRGSWAVEDSASLAVARSGGD
jgi:hypothetical protein